MSSQLLQKKRKRKGNNNYGQHVLEINILITNDNKIEGNIRVPISVVSHIGSHNIEDHPRTTKRVK